MYSVFVLILISSVSNVLSDNNNVVVLSFDGIHPSYITNEFTPNLIQLINDKNGAGPISTRSVYPTKTTVTLFSLSTGLYPCSHGIYNNEMFGSNNEIWSFKKEQFHTTEGIIPIWIENQNKGGERNSGVMMWPGGEFDYNGTKAQYIEPYNASMDWNQRVEKIVSWVTNAEKKANLVMAYFEDTTCNDKRRIDKHIREHMEKIDKTIQKLYNDLNGRLDNFQMIVMSDHGTKKIEYTNVLDVKSYLSDFKEEEYKIIISGPLVFIKPETREKYNEMMTKLSGSVDSVAKYVPLSVNDFFDHYNLYLQSLSDVIVVAARKEYTFMDSQILASKVSSVDGTENFVTYENGYDILDDDMNAFFAGIGNNFRKISTTTIPLEVIDIYQILKVLLDMKTNASDLQKMQPYDQAVRDILADHLFPTVKEENDTAKESGNDDSTSQGANSQDEL